MTPGRFEPLVVEFTERHPYLWLTALAGAMYLPWLGAETVYTTLEGLRLVPAREMLQTGDFLVPRLGGDPYLAKPPLVYWAIALFSLPFGFGEVTPVAGRMVSVVSMWGTMLLVLRFGRTHIGARPAFLAALATGLSALAFEKGSRAELEALLLLTSTVGLVFLYEACTAPRLRTGLVALAALGLGAAILTKGPVPLVAFACSAAALVAARPSWRTGAVLAATLVGAVLVCVPWVLGLVLRFESGELMRVLDVELLGRVEAADAINEEGPFYYLLALVRGMAPFSLLLPGLAALRRSDEPRPLLLMLLAWSFGTLVAISFSSGKEARYLLPTYPAWGLLIGWGFCQRERLPALVRYGRGLLTAGLALGWVLPAALAGVVLAYGVPEARGIGLALCVGLLGGRALIHWGAPSTGASGRALVSALGLILCLVSARGIWAEVYWPSRAPGYPFPEIGAGIDRHVGETETVLLLGRVSANLQYYIERPMDRIGSRALARCVAGEECSGRFLLSDQEIPTGARELERWPAKRRMYRLYAFDTAR